MKYPRFAVIVTCLLSNVFPGTRFAIGETAKSFRYRDLKKLIQNNEKISSVEDLMVEHYELLPVPVRNRHVLVHQSGSLQFASPDFPRIILFSEKADFIMAVTGHPKQFGFNVIEVIDFNYETETFDFLEINFQKNGKRVEFSDGIDAPKPTRCTACHSNSPRPNFQPYNLWPETYGLMDSGRIGFQPTKPPTSLIDTPEKLMFERFLKMNSKKGRHKGLTQLPTSIEDALFEDQFQYKFYVMHKDPTVFKGMHGAWCDTKYPHPSSFHNGHRSFLQEVGRLTMRQAARKILNLKQFPRIKEAIGAALRDCADPSVFLPADIARRKVGSIDSFVRRASDNMLKFRMGLIEAAIPLIGGTPEVPLAEYIKEVQETGNFTKWEKLSPKYHDLYRPFLGYDLHSVIGKLEYLFALLDIKITIHEMANTHTFPGYGFQYSDGHFGWLIQALRRMGNLQNHPLFSTKPLSGSYLSKCGFQANPRIYTTYAEKDCP